MAAGLILWGAPGPAWGAEEPFSFLAEEARVVTASRRDQSLGDSPVTIEVITQEDIRASGAVNLWDLLRYRAGMDVLDSRDAEMGNRAAVAVRGSPQDFVENLQVLVDGRSVYNNVTGAALWEQLSVQVQDIERIELVKGPNAAIYGSNAAAGVVNIITRKPDGAASASAGALGGNRGLRQETVAVESSAGRFRHRTSFTHRSDEGFPDAAGGRLNDFVNRHNLNFRGNALVAKRTKVELFGGVTASRWGVINTLNSSAHVDDDYQMVKLTHDLGDGAVELMTAHSEGSLVLDPSFGGAVSVRAHQYDTQFLHRFGWGAGRLHTTWGGDFRYTQANSARVFASSPRQTNRVLRGFAQQTVVLSPRWTFVGAASREGSDIAGVAIAYQASLIHRPWRNHSFRATHAVATTLPTFFRNAADYRAGPTVRFMGNPDLMPTTMLNNEVGYRGRHLGGRLEHGETVFFTHQRDISGAVPAGVSGGVANLTFQNVDWADAFGVTSSVSHKFKRLNTVFANHTYEDITDTADLAAVKRTTPRHKVNLGGRVAVKGGVLLSAQAGWRDGYRWMSAGRPVDVRPHWRLDARAGWTRGPLEVFVAGTNLTRPQRPPQGSGPDIPRMIHAGFDVTFGGPR